MHLSRIVKRLTTEAAAAMGVRGRGWDVAHFLRDVQRDEGGQHMVSCRMLKQLQ